MNGSTSGYLAFTAPATVSTSTTWTLPAADGAPGQVLTTNGTASLSWTTPAGGGGSTLTCPSGFTASTSNGAWFCIQTTSYDNSSSANLGIGGSSSNVGTLISNCASVGGVVCSYAQLYSANAAGLIKLNQVGGTGGTSNGNGAFTSETMFYPDAINYNQNSSYCPYINGSGAFATMICSQTRSFFCCR